VKPIFLSSALALAAALSTLEIEPIPLRNGLEQRHALPARGCDHQCSSLRPPSNTVRLAHLQHPRPPQEDVRPRPVGRDDSSAIRSWAAAASGGEFVDIGLRAASVVIRSASACDGSYELGDELGLRSFGVHYDAKRDRSTTDVLLSARGGQWPD